MLITITPALTLFLLTYFTYITPIFVKHPMLYFTGANIIINEEPLYKIEPLL